MNSPTPQDLRELVDWALRSAGTIVTLNNAPEATDDELRLQKLILHEEANTFMFDAMPQRLLEVANKISDDVAKRVEEDLVVEQFRAELDKFL